jgi:hypothetical protein
VFSLYVATSDIGPRLAAKAILPERGPSFLAVG